MSKYYGEELNPKNEFRSDYESSISAFVDDNLINAKDQRKKFFSPTDYKQNPDFYHKQFVDSLGFPLNSPLPTPKLISKTLWVRLTC